MTETRKHIDAYCARISYAGPPSPTLAVLDELVLAHTTTIPFENVDVLLKRPIRLDLPSLYEKLVYRRRGGYCFEHNLLFLDVLGAFGFRAHGLAARVTWGRPPGAIVPRTHMLLRVDLTDGPYLADVGFGGITPTAPLALRPQAIQPTAHGTFRLVEGPDEFALEVRAGERWIGLYRFSLQPQLPVDYEVANWFTATHPQSLFVNHLVACRAEGAQRLALFNNRLTIRDSDGASGGQRILTSLDDFAELLGERFGIGSLDLGDIAAIAAIATAQAAHPSPFESG
jgi:N-hydroxyarylamine O-acetyltransferase